MLFYICLMAFPVAQFIVMYLCVNFNSILLSFRNYDTKTGAYSFAGVDNFKRVFYLLFRSPEIGRAWANSFTLYLVLTFIGVPLGLLFSFYIYKKLFLHDVFKVLLFLPSVLSVVIMAILFRYFTENAVPEIWKMFFGKTIGGLFSNVKTVFPLLLFFNLWMNFGPNILMYVGSMSGISDSLSESAQLDGCSLLQEFLHITIPCIYPTIVTFLVVNLVSVFTNQMYLYNFYQASADLNLYTFGYYLFRNTQKAMSVSEYPVLAGMGFVFTLVIVPVTLFVRKLLVKYGPSVD